jgi:hypothetical protein
MNSSWDSLGFCCDIFDERFWFYEVDPGQVCGLRKVLTAEILCTDLPP